MKTQCNLFLEKFFQFFQFVVDNFYVIFTDEDCWMETSQVL